MTRISDRSVIRITYPADHKVIENACNFRFQDLLQHILWLLLNNQQVSFCNVLKCKIIYYQNNKEEPNPWQVPLTIGGVELVTLSLSGALAQWWGFYCPGSFLWASEPVSITRSIPITWYKSSLVLHLTTFFLEVQVYTFVQLLRPHKLCKSWYAVDDPLLDFRTFVPYNDYGSKGFHLCSATQFQW